MMGRNEDFEATYRKQIKMEWDAIEGTYKAIQERCSDKIILDRIETIIKHARLLGNFETGLKRGVTI